MPAIGSAQHVILQMQAEKELGDPKKLNNQIVAMAHPDGTAAILSKREITCHLSSPPFQFEQLRDPGIHKVFDSFQAVGGSHTFNLVWASEKWVKANPKLVKAFIDALKEATDFVNEKPADAVKIYATSERSKSTADELLSSAGSSVAPCCVGACRRATEGTVRARRYGGAHRRNPAITKSLSNVSASRQPTDCMTAKLTASVYVIR
jgi:NitT/TauT family transport system substrate-binding protein